MLIFVMRGTFSPIKDIQQIRVLRVSVGWRPRTKKQWKEILKKSSFVYSVWEGKKLIGMGRAVDDGAMYIMHDLVVHKNYQRKGIGRQIMLALLQKIKHKEKYSMIGGFPDEKKSVIRFYKSLGFKLIKGMKL